MHWGVHWGKRGSGKIWHPLCETPACGSCCGTIKTFCMKARLFSLSYFREQMARGGWEGHWLWVWNGIKASWEYPGENKPRWEPGHAMCQKDFEAAQVTPSWSLPCVTPAPTARATPLPSQAAPGSSVKAFGGSWVQLRSSTAPWSKEWDYKHGTHICSWRPCPQLAKKGLQGNFIFKRSQSITGK